MKETNIEELLTKIYNSTYDDVLRYVTSKCRNYDDIGDLLQNTYLSFYRALKSKRDIKDPKKYLITIARNEIYKHYGILKIAYNYIPIFSANDEESFNKFQEDLKTESNYDEGILCKEIWNYLKQGDMLTFKIFLLYFKNDLKIKDIGIALNISESTVKNRLYRTLNKINNEFNI